MIWLDKSCCSRVQCCLLPSRFSRRRSADVVVVSIRTQSEFGSHWRRLDWPYSFFGFRNTLRRGDSIHASPYRNHGRVGAVGGSWCQRPPFLASVSLPGRGRGTKRLVGDAMIHLSLRSVATRERICCRMLSLISRL
jgi:hypothetical protein